MKIHEIMETASAGATSAGSIATVVNPTVAHSNSKPKKQKPTDNALDNDDSLFDGSTIKRDSKKPLASL